MWFDIGWMEEHDDHELRDIINLKYPTEISSIILVDQLFESLEDDQ